MARTTRVPDGYLEIGHIRRAHGLRGDVFVQLVTDRTERLDAGTSLLTERGALVVETSRMLPNGRWIVKFEGIADRTQGERWTNVALHGEPITDAGALWVHELIGARVVEADGTPRGTCVSVLANPASDILELDTGALVPSTFIVSNDLVDAARVITVDVPDGLFTVNDDADSAADAVSAPGAMPATGTESAPGTV
jgi:16S rRNA processing protein RimM